MDIPKSNEYFHYTTKQLVSEFRRQYNYRDLNRMGLIIDTLIWNDIEDWEISKHIRYRYYEGYELLYKMKKEIEKLYKFDISSKYPYL